MRIIRRVPATIPDCSFTIPSADLYKNSSASHEGPLLCFTSSLYANHVTLLERIAFNSNETRFTVRGTITGILISENFIMKYNDREMIKKY